MSVEYSSRDHLGMVAYGAYKNAVGGKSVIGAPLPEWHEQEQRIRDAWSHAAVTVVTAHSNLGTKQ